MDEAWETSNISTLLRTVTFCASTDRIQRDTKYAGIDKKICETKL